MNRHGGIAGRKVKLDVSTTGGTPEAYARAVSDACARDLAIVAGLSTDDRDAGGLGCGIPDIAVATNAPEHARSATTYATFPHVDGTVAVGPYRYLQSAVDSCCSQLVVIPEDEPGRSATEAQIAGASAVGFDTAATPQVATDATDADYDAIAQEVLDTDATFAASGLGRASTISLRRAAARAGVAGVDAWYCDARCYDDSFLTDGSADVEDQYVAIDTVPFSDRRKVPALRAYLGAVARAGDEPGYDGLRAYATGLLAQQALQQVVEAHGDDGVTRAHLLDALDATQDFTADGLIGPTDVADRTPSGCTVVLQVHDGRFTRVHPDERGSLDCEPQNLVELDQ